MNEITQKRRKQVLHIHDLLKKIQVLQSGIEIDESSNLKLWETAQRWEQKTFLAHGQQLNRAYGNAVKKKLIQLESVRQRNMLDVGAPPPLKPTYGVGAPPPVERPTRPGYQAKPRSSHVGYGSQHNYMRPSQANRQYQPIQRNQVRRRQAVGRQHAERDRNPYRQPEMDYVEPYAEPDRARQMPVMTRNAPDEFTDPQSYVQQGRYSVPEPIRRPVEPPQRHNYASTARTQPNQRYPASQYQANSQTVSQTQADQQYLNAVAKLRQRFLPQVESLLRDVTNILHQRKNTANIERTRKTHDLLRNIKTCLLDERVRPGGMKFLKDYLVPQLEKISRVAEQNQKRKREAAASAQWKRTDANRAEPLTHPVQPKRKRNEHVPVMPTQKRLRNPVPAEVIVIPEDDEVKEEPKPKPKPKRQPAKKKEPKKRARKKAAQRSTSTKSKPLPKKETKAGVESTSSSVQPQANPSGNEPKLKLDQSMQYDSPSSTASVTAGVVVEQVEEKAPVAPPTGLDPVTPCTPFSPPITGTVSRDNPITGFLDDIPKKVDWDLVNSVCEEIIQA